MDQRVQFIADWCSGRYTKVALCGHYGVSRPTGDKWINRYEEQGVDGLKELSRRPHGCAHETPEDIVEAIVQMKLAHQSFGPKKVMDRLRALEPHRRWPADSTAGELLKRRGLVTARRRRRRVSPHPEALLQCNAPAQSWSADFKGDFCVGNGERCYPLTVADNYSRYVLQCRGLSHTTTAAVQPWFEWAFREHGLPDAMRTDNGAPFASLALGGISRLSKWWIRLGVRPERTRPATPSDNGRHERMHRSLKAAAITPAATTLQRQQQRFDAFVHEFNWQRSHESLQRQTPGHVHHGSERPYPAKLPDVEYETTTTVRKVRHNGQIKWRGQLLYVSDILAKEPVGLTQLHEGLWELRYSFHLLGTLDERTMSIKPAQHWHLRD